jgi:class 3 adenylate cyclase
MEPRIQYAKASDGVSIAYAVAGSGPPLVYTRTWTGTNVQLDWDLEFPGTVLRALAATRTLITFDRRGAGLSDRDVPELTLEKFTLDLEAVVEDVGLERFVLLGGIFGVMTNTIYALRHPERVSAWISHSGAISGRAFWQSPRNRAMRAMREADFDTYIDTINNISGNPRLGEVFRASITPEGQKAFVDASETFDATDLLPQLDLPALVLYRTDSPNGPSEADFARHMAKLIRGARLVAVPWEPRDAHAERVTSAIDAFLNDVGSGQGGDQSKAREASAQLATILFTDLASSTALTQRLGDAQAQDLLRAHNAIVREALQAHGGHEIKHTGDGIMASFPTASGALDCAVAIQRAVAAQDDANLQVHVGLNAGEPVAEDEDLFGTAVQLARRICDEAQAGEILVSNVVRELAAGKNFLFADRGAAALKGFEDPVRLYEVRWRD